MKTYTYALTAATPILLPFGGRQFFLMDSAYPVDVEFFDASGQNAGEKLEAIPSGSWAEPDAGFSSLRLTSATAQNVKFIIATGRAGVFRIAGDVSVVEGGKARTIANQAFMGQGSASPVAAQFSHVQLLNPAASGVRVMVEQLLVSSDVAGPISLFRCDAALTNLVMQPPSKLIGGAAALAQIRQQTSAAGLWTGDSLASMRVLASSPAPALVLHEPIVLLPGRGVLIVASVFNALVTATFEFFEEGNT